MATEHQPIDDGTHALAPTGRLRKFFETCIKLKASDIHVKPHVPVRFRLNGELKAADASPFSPEELLEEVEAMLTKEQLDFMQHHGSIDMAYAYDEDNRFRVNIFRAKGLLTIAARRVSSEILSVEELHLPASLNNIAKIHQGLVLLCGVTGSGKSTTIAALLQKINETRQCHILTLEDPIEYMFKDRKAVVNQREVGVDVPDFTIGLRALVREDPDVVLIGELRDAETFEAAVRAAETGHLVFGTVHASSCVGAFNRIYNLFPPEKRDMIRDMLSQNVQAFVYQRLMKSIKEGVSRIPAVEVLLGSPVVLKYIEEGREIELGDVIKNSQQEGMISYHRSLVDLVQRELIHPKVAIELSRNPDELRMLLKGIESGNY